MKSFLTLLLLFSHLAHADISLGELGIGAEVSPSAPTLPAAAMEERRSDLQKHQVLGLTTLGLMLATAFTGGSAIDSNTHMYLGFATAGLYGATAYYSLSAPKPKGVKDRGRVKWHKALAWVHAPLMVITPYLGYLYKKHEEDGKKHSSLEKQHSTAAGLLIGSFALSATLMIVEF